MFHPILFFASRTLRILVNKGRNGNPLDNQWMASQPGIEDIVGKAWDRGFPALYVVLRSGIGAVVGRV